MPRMSELLFSLGAFWCAAVCVPLVGAELGDVPAGGFRSPEGDLRFTTEAGAKPLNNLVFELLNVQAPGETEYRFQNPRQGWVYIRLEADSTVQPILVQLDDQPIPLAWFEGQHESMRHLSEGMHKIAVRAATATTARLEVRAVGELIYAAYGSNPHIEETGVHTWGFLRQHCLDHFNSMIGASTRNDVGTSTQEAEIREWVAVGKRWFTREDVPYDVDTAEAVRRRWSNSLGMQHPSMSGIWLDEFGVGEKYGKKTSVMYPLWKEALCTLHADPQFSGHGLYAYMPSRLLPTERYEEMRPFVQSLMEGDDALGPEWYLPEGQSRPNRTIASTGDLLAEFSPGWELASRDSFERIYKGAASNRIINVAIFSEPGWESCDVSPAYDFNVFLDCELQFIATDPSFFGVRGLQGYLSSYCGEEQLRLFARLVRHYAIEGKTRRFLEDPYVLPHLRNGDFADGAQHWNLAPAGETEEKPSIDVRSVGGFGILQGRYHALPDTGDTALYTRRSLRAPNVISQPLRSLTPGRLYSLRLITGDLREFESGRSIRRKHAVSTTIDGADRIASKCFQAVVKSGFWYPHGGFNATNPYWLNYHQVVFRPRKAEVTLRLSDWLSDASPGGPSGEELIWNFVQVQPYFAEPQANSSTIRTP